MKEKIKSKFGKSVMIIASGTFLAQFINVIFSPIITRIFSPEEYGYLTAYTAIIALIAIGTFKYEMAIPISKDDKNAINVLVLCMLILSLFVLSLIMFFTFFIDLSMLDLDSNSTFLVPLGVFLLGTFQVFRQWALRKKDFKTLSKTTVYQSLFGNLVKVITGILGFRSIGLVIGHIIGQSAGIKQLAKPIFIKRNELIKDIKLKRILWNAKRYKDFPLYNFPTHFLSTFGGKAPIIFSTFIYGSQVAGFYGLAYSIVRLPMTLLGKAIGDVFYAEAASLGREEPVKLRELSNELIKKMIIIGSIPVITILLFGPTLFSIVFGAEWYNAGIYARIISIMLFSIFIFAPISRVYEVFERQKLRLVIDMVRVIFIITVFFVSWIFNLNSYIAILLYSMVIAVVHLVIYIFAQRILNEEIFRRTS